MICLTHLPIFVAGLRQFQTTVTSDFLENHCPCGLDPNPPDIVGEGYFCESVIEENI